MTEFMGFSEDTFRFFGALALNNNKEWFTSHASAYESCVLEPSLALIRAMAPCIGAISPYYTAVAKKTGGSLMRLYRDTRFSLDKTPYKTNIGIMFKHQDPTNAHAPSFYVHLAVDECFAGLGTWHPEASALLSIRKYIAANPDQYQRAVADSIANSSLTVYGDSLKRIPKGFAHDHPLASDLRRKDFLLSTSLAPELYLRPALVDELSRLFKTASPYMAFLCKALGIAF